LFVLTPRSEQRLDRRVGTAEAPALHQGLRVGLAGDQAPQP
jgi:hypothetical protein